MTAPGLNDGEKIPTRTKTEVAISKFSLPGRVVANTSKLSGLVKSVSKLVKG